MPQEECVGAILKGYNNKDYEQFLEWIKNAQSDRILELSRKYLDSEKKSRCVFGKEVPEGFVEEKLSSFIWMNWFFQLFGLECTFVYLLKGWIR